MPVRPYLRDVDEDVDANEGAQLPKDASSCPPHAVETFPRFFHSDISVARFGPSPAADNMCRPYNACPSGLSAFKSGKDRFRTRLSSFLDFSAFQLPTRSPVSVAIGPVDNSSSVYVGTLTARMVLQAPPSGRFGINWLPCH